MSKTSLPLQEDEREYAADPRDKPAIGIIGYSGRIDNELMGAILRSTQNGHEVLLFTDGSEGERDELLNLLSDQSVTLVQPENWDSESDIRSKLSQTARDLGFPGLILYDSPSDSIDFEESAESVMNSEAYCVPAVPSSKHTEAKYIVAGIPAYNEELGIGSVVHAVKQYVDQVIVIDDGSLDDTAVIARQAGAKVIRHDSNRGKGAALRTLLEQVDANRCDALVLLDGDGQHLPSDIPQVVQPVINDEADLVIGSRYLDSRDRDETPRYRRVGQQFLDFLTFGTSKRRISDSQSGLRALSPTALEEISIRTNGFGAESEMIDSAVRTNLRITERPIDIRYKDIDGHTKSPIAHGLEVVGFVVYLIRDRRPLLFFGLPGLIVTLAGVLYGIDGIIIYQNTGQFYPAKAFTSGFLTILGVLSLFVGLILNQISSMISNTVVSTS